MSWRNGFAAFTLILAVGAAGYLSYRYLVAPPSACQICGRSLHAKLRGALTWNDGSSAEVCCSRCALHAKASSPARVTRIELEDSETGDRIDGESATYLEGSDAAFCHPEPEVSPREPGIAYERKFDRCLPSLIAFKSEAEARAYKRRYGGRILSYQEALESVRHR
jgi:hypothetical protein